MVVTTGPLKFGSAAVGIIINHTFGHERTFIKFMEQNVGIFGNCQIVVDPDFIRGDKVVDKFMAAFGEINVKIAADQAAVNKPDFDTGSGVGEETKMDLGRIGNARAAKNFIGIAAAGALGALFSVSVGNGNVVTFSLFHQFPFDQKVVDKKTALVRSSLIFQPKLIFGNAIKTEMLTKISELLVKIGTDKSPIDGVDF